MDVLQEKAEKIVVHYGKKLTKADKKKLYAVIANRTDILCAKHYVNKLEQSGAYESYYLNGVKTFMAILQDNPKLLSKSDEFLVRAKPWELVPKAWHEPLERKKNKELIESAQNKQQINSDEKCPNCKVVGKSYCFDLKQMRSADEPMTQLWRCDNCNHRWNV
jgi:DNA-directed RNA polymerase subunit M/transcription elongation factor TFIIS